MHRNLFGDLFNFFKFLSWLSVWYISVERLILKCSVDTYFVHLRVINDLLFILMHRALYHIRWTFQNVDVQFVKVQQLVVLLVELLVSLEYWWYSIETNTTGFWSSFRGGLRICCENTFCLWTGVIKYFNHMWNCID